MDDLIRYENEPKEYEFYFSIIMAVYNVEPFIEEAIQSLIDQDFGFEQNVQLILVDDGSPDKSGEICDRYKELYPNNIVVVHKENGGVSSARNAGFTHVRGKYVNFMDPDDKLSKNTLKNVFVFFEQHYNEIDLVVIPIIFFDGRTGQHPLNEMKFSKGSRVIDLEKEYKCVLLSMATLFMKQSRLKNIEFDTRLTITEDGKEVQKLLLVNPKFGAVSNCKYLYRKRTQGEPSALDGAVLQKAFYCNWLEFFALSTLKNAQQKLGYIPNFTQYTIMQDIQWRIKITDIPEGILTKEEETYIWCLFKEILQYIDDSMILEQKSIFIEHKLYLLNLKYGKSATVIPIKDDAILLHNKTFIRYLSSIYMRIDFIKYNKQQLEFEGRVMCLNCSLDEKINVYAIVNEIPYLCETIILNDHGCSLNQVIFRSAGFKIALDIDDSIHDYKIYFKYEYRGHLITKKDVRFSKFTPIAKELSSCYYYKDRRVLTFNKYTFTFKKCGRKGLIKHELAFLKSVKQKYKKDFWKIAITRIYTRLRNYFSRKEIWILSDRINVADDNGKAFFQYLCKKRPKNVKLYFLIDKNSKDYGAMKKIGKVIDFNSYKNKLYHLQATNIISSSTSDIILNPFHEENHIYRDLLQKNYVFLQHGITKDDVSKMLNKYIKNIKLFITAAKPEYNSIIDNDYYYSKNEVLLSGFPRYDLLYNNPKKIITIMPTWRKHLTVGKLLSSGIWNLIDDFNTSDYCIFYNSLLNNEVLLSNAKRLGYKVVFFPHPTIMPYIDRFTKHHEVEFINFDKPYREIFAESDLIVNDYSSASMDFSYLRKPVVYAQFDKEEFFTKHYKPGYFSYEDNGFGEVEYTLEDTVNRIIEYMENGCKLKDKYRARIDEFFAFNDKNNCQRVYEAILELDKD